MNELTTVEAGRRAELVGIVRKGLAEFVAVGKALAEIRDARLYRDTHGDFANFCRDEFNLSKSHAHRLIESAGIAERVSPIGDKPDRESHVRPLRDLPLEQQAETWREAVKTAPKGNNGKPKVTGEHVQKVVARKVAASNPVDPVEPFEVPPEPAPEPITPWQQVAAEAVKIIESLQAVVAQMESAFGVVNHSKTEHEITHPGARRYSWSMTVGAINQVINDLKFYMPIGQDARGVVVERDRLQAEAFAKKGGRAS